MYTGRIICCPLVSNDKYADRTDRCQTITLSFPQNAASIITGSFAIFPITISTSNQLLSADCMQAGKQDNLNDWHQLFFFHVKTALKLLVVCVTADTAEGACDATPNHLVSLFIPRCWIQINAAACIT